MNNRRRAMIHKDSGRDYLCFTALEQGTFTFSIHSAVTTGRINHISYSIDGGKTWVTAYKETNKSVRLTTPIIKPGGRVLWKGKGGGAAAFNINRTCRFSATCLFEASGNAMSVFYEDTFENQKYATTYLFAGLFSYCDKIVKASILPNIGVRGNSYAYMFCGCTNLIEGPELHATSLYARCYRNMFDGCTSLIKAPNLPAITLNTACYTYMFAGCTSLTTAPTLPATKLVSICYEGMFDGCTSLNHVKAMFTTEPSDDYTLDWLNGVAANGTFVKNSAAEWTNRGTNAIPENWTIQIANE